MLKIQHSSTTRGLLSTMRTKSGTARWRALLLALGCPLAAAPGQDPPPAPLVITNVNVLPMDRERILAARTVVVAGGAITAVGGSGTVRIPEGARTIDGTGKYLVPGLADLHVHLASAITCPVSVRTDARVVACCTSSATYLVARVMRAAA
jgi:adenine deaminase